MMQYKTPRTQYTLLQPTPENCAAYAAPRRHAASRWARGGCVLLTAALLIFLAQDPKNTAIMTSDITASMVKMGLIGMNASLLHCQINHKSQPDSEYFDALDDARARWLAPACQRFFYCNDELLLTQRTCTAEDKLSESMHPEPHVTRLLVSERYRTVYVVNPTTVDYLVQHILTTALQAREQSSLQISHHMIESFFFFTFVDDPQARFFYAAEERMRAGWDANASCASRVREMAPMAQLHSPHHNVIHSQAYQLSADAGVSNTMLRLNWVRHANTFRTSIVNLIRQIQHWNRECVPEIDFREINFQLITQRREAQERAMLLRMCSQPALSNLSMLLLATYTQDNTCFA